MTGSDRCGSGSGGETRGGDGGGTRRREAGSTRVRIARAIMDTSSKPVSKTLSIGLAG